MSGTKKQHLKSNLVKQYNESEITERQENCEIYSLETFIYLLLVKMTA